MVLTINIMNYILDRKTDELLKLQAGRLQELLNDVLHCCEDRRLYESQKFGLPYAELRCLMLFRGEKYLTVKGIAQKLDVAKSRITKLIEGLLNKGLVDRMEDPKDARVKLISLTKKGREKTKEIEEFQRQIHEQILLRLDEEERNRILTQLETLKMAMEAVRSELI